MAARERKPNEDFEDYRKNLKEEEAETRRKISGRLVWCSATLALDEEKSEPPFGMVYKKVVVEGTYIRGVGKLLGSQADKNRYDKLLSKLRKKGVLKDAAQRQV